MTPLRWTMLATHVPASGGLGGVVRYTTELMAALGERDDVAVTAVTTRSAGPVVAELVGAGGSVLTVPDLPTPALSVLERRLPLPALRTDADVVHGMKHLVPNHSNATRVLTAHDMLLLDRPDDFGSGKRLLLPRPYLRSIRASDLVICVSAATADRVAAHVPGAAARCAVVHLATSSALRDAVPVKPTALAGRRFALVVGDPTPRKNLATVMRAWRDSGSRRNGAALAIAGPPSWGDTELGVEYDELVRDGAVVPLGYVSDPELRWAYENAAVVLCPSLAEGFGLPAAEALDLGAPVLISDDAALREVCAGRERAVIAARDVGAWTAAIDDALSSPEPPRPASVRTWADVAEETVAAVYHARQGARRA